MFIQLPFIEGLLFARHCTSYEGIDMERYSLLIYKKMTTEQRQFDAGNIRDTKYKMDLQLAGEWWLQIYALVNKVDYQAYLN